MNEPTVVSLCTGAGGLDLGLERVGYRTLAVAEVDRDACAVLVGRFPGVPNLGDLREIEWERVVAELGRPDVVAAGFPCQPLSLAGKGLVEADPRWLWPEVARCLRVVRPRLVLLENVPGIFRRPPNGGPRPVGVVLGDLAALGYDALWTGLRSADLGAPHGRDRWFCVGVLTAEPERAGVDADGRVRRGGSGEPRRPAQAAVPAGEEASLAADALADRAGAPADADRQGREGAEPEPAGGRRGPADGGRETAPDAGRERRRGGGQSEPRRVEGSRGGLADGRGEVRELGDASASPADADVERGESGGGRRASGGDHARAGAEEPDGDRLVGSAEPGTVEWGAYGPAVERWERVLGRAAPQPTDDLGRLNPRFAEWMLGYPYGWVEVDGVSRTAQLRLIGNSVQVQCGEVVGLWLAEAGGLV